MRPCKPDFESASEDLFRSRLEAIIDPRHRLMRLSKVLDWSVFDEVFAPLYHERLGSPGLPTRLMVGLHLIKHMAGISDEAVCARFLDSPYVQAFCGEDYFQFDLLLDRSSMTNWRKRYRSVVHSSDKFYFTAVCPEPWLHIGFDLPKFTFNPENEWNGSRGLSLQLALRREFLDADWTGDGPQWRVAFRDGNSAKEKLVVPAASAGAAFA